MNKQVLVGPSRRALLALPLLLQLPTAWAVPAGTVEVWKGAGCGCCGDWVSHLKANGLAVVVHDGGNIAARRRLGINEEFASCHTALLDGYAIEGHVPVSAIRRLLSERPRAIGLAVPGMPLGSPGMDGPAYQGRKQPYEVLLLTADGRSSVYASIR